MPKLRVLSGEDVVKIFLSLGFLIDSQRGSHVKLVRFLESGTKQALTIPLHHELDKGTLSGIYRQALRYCSEVELRSEFYTE